MTLASFWNRPHQIDPNPQIDSHCEEDSEALIAANKPTLVQRLAHAFVSRREKL